MSEHCIQSEYGRQADLDRLRAGDNSASLLGSWLRHTVVSVVATDRPMMRSSLGQISASLAAMHRTVDDYGSMAKCEIIKAKQEKAQM